MKILLILIHSKKVRLVDKKNYITLWGLLLGFFIVFLIVYFFIILKISSKPEDLSGAIEFSGNGKEKIGVIEIKGAIYESKKYVKLLHQAEENKSIKAIILRINSPGGAVGPSQEIYQEVLRIDKIKPVYSSFETLAASGGYYIAAATRKIYSNAGALTGSIGVISQFFDASEIYKTLKLNPQIIKSGRYKDLGSPHRALKPEESQYMIELLNDVHDQFRRDILSLRKKKLKKPIEEISQGQVFTGEKAKEIGLVDEIESLWGAARKIHKELKIKSKLDLVFIKEKEKNKFSEFFKGLESKIEEIGVTFFSKLPLYLY
jgi:protease IV